MQKHCLAIETTGRHFGLALVRFDEETARRETRAAEFSEEPLRQSDLLIPRLDRLLKKSRLTKGALQLIAVDIGPGSFTGVRVGVAAARALAQALQIPIVGVNSLEALAEGTAGDVGDRVLSRRPALANEAYFAIYERMKAGWKIRHAPTWDTEENLQALLAMPVNKTLVTMTGDPHPVAIATLALRRYRTGSRTRFRYDQVRPLYLQPSWAERSLKASV